MRPGTLLSLPLPDGRVGLCVVIKERGLDPFSSQPCGPLFAPLAFAGSAAPSLEKAARLRILNLERRPSYVARRIIAAVSTTDESFVDDESGSSYSKTDPVLSLA